MACLAGRVQADSEPPPYERELRFASGLVRLGFPDFAERIVDAVLLRYPAARPHAAFVRIEMLTSRGRFDEAREVIAAMPPDATETLSMQLALGDAFYAWNRIRDAREIYDAFFARFPRGPPPALASFYKESAYRYAQMLMNSGHEEDALKAYGFILLTEPEREVKRRIQTEMAELAVRLGTHATGEKRQTYFDQARKLCTDIQWGGLDLWFGKTVVILTQIEVVHGNTERARGIIRDYLPMLKQIDDALRAEKAPMRFSPMAEARYQLGLLHLRDAQALVEADKENESFPHFRDALRHLHNVFIQYPGSAWAMEAGNETRRIVNTLEGMGRQVRIPPFDMTPVIQAQLQEARMLLDMNDFERAETAYRSLLNLFPEEPATVPALAELARCYLEMGDLLYAEAVSRYLAERFHARPAFAEEAGTALLRVAGFYETAALTDEMQKVYSLFFRFFPEHSRASALLMRQGENAFRDEDYERALEYFGEVRTRFPDSRAALDAMSRIAFCHSARGEHTNAIPILTEYRAALAAGPSKISAHYRLADGYRLSGQYMQAAREYRDLTNLLGNEDEAARFIHTPEDVPRQRAIYERAIFWRAFSLSRLREPEAQIAAFQNAAITGYRTFMEMFPNSDLAPTALSLKGALLLVLDRSEDAARIYDRLARDFPESEQARNAVFSQGTSLIELGQMERAIEVFEQMFENAEAFSPAQFLRVGRVMLDEQQFEMALRALDIALTADERPTWENAAIWKGQALTRLDRFAETAAIMDTLLERYPTSAHSIEAGFLLSMATARVAAELSDARARADGFQKAIRALRNVRRIAQEPVDRARADIELAGIQRLMGNRDEALASYLRLFLLGNINDPKVRPMIEGAYEAAVPLLFDTEQYDEVIDTSRVYLELFPSGRRVSDARRWRDRARILLAQAGGDIAMPGETDDDGEDFDFEPAEPDPAGVPPPPDTAAPPPETEPADAEDAPPAL